MDETDSTQMTQLSISSSSVSVLSRAYRVLDSRRFVFLAVFSTILELAFLGAVFSRFFYAYSSDWTYVYVVSGVFVVWFLCIQAIILPLGIATRYSMQEWQELISLTNSKVTIQVFRFSAMVISVLIGYIFFTEGFTVDVLVSNFSTIMLLLYVFASFVRGSVVPLVGQIYTKKYASPQLGNIQLDGFNKFRDKNLGDEFYTKLAITYIVNNSDMDTSNISSSNLSGEEQSGNSNPSQVNALESLSEDEKEIREQAKEKLKNHRDTTKLSSTNNISALTPEEIDLLTDEELRLLLLN